MRYIKYLIICCAGLASLSVAAQEPAGGEVAGAEDSGLLDSLFEVLDQETTIATRTKMNSDHVPGMVSVIHGSDARKKGARTVYEALDFLPGVKTSIQQDGMHQLIARGVGNEIASGKVKLLVNGVPFNNTLNGVSVAYSIPLEQVERIEFNHGPGSMIYGEYAFAGVVNVITRRDLEGIATAVDSNDGGLLTAAVHHELMGGRLKMDLNLAGMNTEGPEVNSGTDRWYGTPAQGLSAAPGYTNEEEKVRSGILAVRYGNTLLELQHVYRGLGDHFGLNYSLPESSEGVKRKLTMQTLSLSHDYHLTESFNLDLALGLRQFKLDSEKVQLAPAGFGGQFLAEGMLGGPHYEEVEGYVTAAGTLQKGIHELSFGLEYHNIEQGDTWVNRNYDPNAALPTEIPYGRYEGADNWIAEDLNREVVGGWIQEQANFTDRFYVAGGTRVDIYDGEEVVWSPRLATVYKFSDRHIFKFQAAKAYRPPSFLEKYVQNNAIVKGNDRLVSEEVTNYELGYVMKIGGTVLRATSYMSHLRNLVNIDPISSQFQNDSKADLRGAELQVETRLGRAWLLSGAYSNISAETKHVNDRMPGVPENLVDLSVSFMPVSEHQLTLQWAYVDKRTREDGDTRDPLDSYQTLDLTWYSGSIAGSDVDIFVSLRNILDAEVKEPAPLVSTPFVKPSYQDDYPRQGRNWWLSINYRI